MKTANCYENYPRRIILLSNLVQASIYGIGGFVMYSVGIIWLAVYILYLLWLEIRLLGRSCVNCYYYGKFCAFGKGKLAAWLFKRGDAAKFNRDKITWRDIIPDFLVSIIPLIAGIVLLIINFKVLLLVLLVLLVLAVSLGSGLIRGKLACRYCRQRELGCPAEQLFSKKGGNS
jgi:hypothetical protein